MTRERGSAAAARRTSEEQAPDVEQDGAAGVGRFRRALVLALRDPTVYLGRVVVFMAACSFFSILCI